MALRDVTLSVALHVVTVAPVCLSQSSPVRVVNI